MGSDKAAGIAPNGALVDAVLAIIEQARAQVKQSVNSAMVQAYWRIGKLIIEDEQQGQTRAQYGKAQLKHLSDSLSNAFGKGFDLTNLRNMRRFYLAFPIRETMSLELSWSHYNVLMHPSLPSRHREPRHVHGSGYRHKLRHPREGGDPEAYQYTAGLCKSATLDDFKANDYVLTPGRYVGAADAEEDGELFADKMARLTAQLKTQFAESDRLEAEIKKNLAGLGYDV